MLLGFNARIRNMVHFDGHAHLPRGTFHQVSQVHDGKLFGELVVNAAFASRRGVVTGNLDAAYGIANIQKSTRLAAFAVNRERLADGCLYTETVQYRTKDVIVIEAVNKRFVERRFVGHRPIHYALIQVRGANAPNLAREHDVVAVVHLGKVIEGSWLLRERHGVSAAVVLEGDVAFFDVDVGRAIFAHGAKLDEMAIGQELAHGKEHVQRANDVVHLRKHGVFAVDHRVRRGALFGEVDNGLRPK